MWCKGFPVILIGYLFRDGTLAALTSSVLQGGSDVEVTLSNGFVTVSFESSVGLTIGADFLGQSEYTEVLAKPFKAHTRTIAAHEQASKPADVSTPVVTWIRETDEEHVVRISGIFDDNLNPLVSENWTISIRRDHREINLLIEGVTIRDEEGLVALYHGTYLKSSSIYGLFEGRGIAQMMNKTDGCLGSNLSMSRAYAIGNGVSLDYIRPGLSRTSPRQVVLRSYSVDGYASGIEDLVLGSYPDLTTSYERSWSACWAESSMTTTSVPEGTTYRSNIQFIPNDYNFPAYLVTDVRKQPMMPFKDIQTFLSGIYGSPAGCLQGYYDGHWGTIAPTISHPDVGYSPDTNFFDPDNFIALSALMYSGDPFLLEESRRVLERTSNTMCGIGSEQVAAYCDAPRVATAMRTTASSLRFKTPHPSSKELYSASKGREGQLMHHFVDLIPTYESIAGSEQLGPNVFWAWSCLRYISLTQDFDWAVKMFPYIDLSIKYLLTFFDESAGMILSPGPLWIDVLVRENYTSDSNAVMVPFLDLAADMYTVIGPLVGETDLDGFVEELRAIGTTIATTMGSALWDMKSNDHFITQLDPSGATRDFIDYDSNLLAVAFGAVDRGTTDPTAAAVRNQAILNRVDAGEYTHVRGTWCSEVAYTGDACDCYIVGGSVCGDSVVTLARIGWADAHARKRVGDIDTFDNLLLAPLQADLINDVWLYERYDDAGTQIRTPFYFEYPSLVAMMLREVRYGLSIGLNKIEIAPFLSVTSERNFVYAFGNTYLSYASSAVSIMVPSPNDVVRSVSIHGLVADGDYRISYDHNCLSATASKREGAVVSSDGNGVLEFEASMYGESCIVTAALLA